MWLWVTFDFEVEVEKVACDRQQEKNLDYRLVTCQSLIQEFLIDQKGI